MLALNGFTRTAYVCFTHISDIDLFSPRLSVQTS